MTNSTRNWKTKSFFLFLLFLVSCQKAQKRPYTPAEKENIINTKYQYSCNIKEQGYNKCGVITDCDFKKHPAWCDMITINEANDDTLKKMFEEIENFSVNTLSLHNCQLNNNEDILKYFNDIVTLDLKNTIIKKLPTENLGSLHALFLKNSTTSNFKLGYLPSLKRLEINGELKRFNVPAKNLPIIFALQLIDTEIDHIKDINLEGYPKNMWCLISGRYKNKRIKNPKTNKEEWIKIMSNKIALDSVALRKKYPDIRFSFDAPPRYPIVPKYDTW